MGSLFETRKILHGLPNDGDKVKYTNPIKFGFFTSLIENEKLLEFGKEYTVSKTELNSSSTYVWLEEFTEDDVFFSIHSFEWEYPKIDPSKLIGFGFNEVSRIPNYDVINRDDMEDVTDFELPVIIVDLDKCGVVVACELR